MKKRVAAVAKPVSKFSACVLTPLLLAVGVCAVLLVMVSLPVNGGSVDRAEIEKIVADYIAANGEKIQESLVAAQRREQQKATAGLISEETPTRGPDDAKVTIIEFSDFECPFCARVQGTIQAIEKAYPGQLRFAFKQLPLSFHENAKPAAYAALAAHKQGKYWQFAEKLWQSGGSLNEQRYVQIATELGLNMKRFNADRNSPAVVKQVQQDLMDAAKVEARGTPFFFINGEPLSGAVPFDDFKAAVDAALQAANAEAK